MDDYNRDEIEVITHEVELCMLNMPRVQDMGSWPPVIHSECSAKVKDAYRSKEQMRLRDIVPLMVKCMDSYHVKPELVADSKQCLDKVVAKDYHGLQVSDPMSEASRT